LSCGINEYSGTSSRDKDCVILSKKGVIISIILCLRIRKIFCYKCNTIFSIYRGYCTMKFKTDEKRGKGRKGKGAKGRRGERAKGERGEDNYEL
jgi:hypothetical protein